MLWRSGTRAELGEEGHRQSRLSLNRRSLVNLRANVRVEQSAPTDKAKRRAAARETQVKEREEDNHRTKTRKHTLPKTIINTERETMETRIGKMATETKTAEEASMEEKDNKITMAISKRRTVLKIQTPTVTKAIRTSEARPIRTSVDRANRPVIAKWRECVKDTWRPKPN